MSFDNLLIEKYRPHTLSDILLSDQIREKMDEYKEKQEIPNLLFASAPGQGKSSLAHIIVKDILKCDYLYINASDHNGIDTIRTRVIGFAQTRSLNGNIKVVILDEAHNITFDAQSALNNVMEQYAGNTRFILTTNFVHKIIKSIQSRCTKFNFEHKIQDVVKHCYNLLQKEGILVPEDQKAPYVELVKKCFPDIRLTINELSRCTIKNTLSITSIKECETFIAGWFDTIIKDPFEARKTHIQNEQIFQADYNYLLKMLVQYIYKDSKLLTTVQKRDALIIITEYMYKHAFVADPEINCFSCCLQLNKLISG